LRCLGNSEGPPAHYLTASMAAVRRRSDRPWNPLCRAAVSRSAFSSAVMRIFTWVVRAPSFAGVGGLCPSSSK